MATLKGTDGRLPTLDKDGISDELYQLLWSKDELNYGPSINIPDTIVYKYGQPTTWYFTSVNGKVKKKNKHNLISAKIEEAFNKHVMGYDVLALFISMSTDGNEPKASQSHQTTIQYLDRAALNDFLYNRKKDLSGILQRFIEPKSVRNEIVRAIWSPKVCLLERAENKHQLHDHRYGLYERCVIYEGPEYYFTSAPLRGPVLSGQLQKICEQVVAHISEVTYGQKQVSRIVLNFKVDSRDKVWLLYSTSIRCLDMLEYTSAAAAAMTTQRNLVNIDSVVSLSEKVHLNPKMSYEKIVPKRRIRCLSCTRETLEDMRHPVTYKSVIKHYDHVMFLLVEAAKAEGSTNSRGQLEDAMVNWPPNAQIVEAAGGVGFGCLYITDTGELLTQQQIGSHIKPRRVGDLLIPPILHNIHYKLSLKSYKKCKHDPLFLFKTVQVCEACYLVYAEFTTMLLRMGQDLTKLLTPDPSALNLQQSAAAADRPSSADWRALSSTGGSNSGIGGRIYLQHSQSASAVQTQRVGQLRPSANHRHAKKSAIGIRSSETIQQPSVPSSLPMGHAGSLSTVYAGPSGEFKLGGTLFADSMASAPAGGKQQQQQQQRNQQQQRSPAITGAPATMNSPVNGGHLEFGSTSLYDAEEVKQTIAERERHFFKEVSLNPNLKDQHPLMHLITAQEKLRLVDEQSGVLMSKTASKTEGIFGTRYGQQTGDKFSKLGAYKVENPYVVNGEIVLPSVLKVRTKERMRQKKINKERSLRALLNPDDAVAAEEAEEAATAGGGGSVRSAKSLKSAKSIAADPNVKSSVRHREFLKETLKRLEGEVDGASEFAGKYTGSLDEPPSQAKKSSKAKSAAGNGDDYGSSNSVTSSALSVDSSASSRSGTRTSRSKSIAHVGAADGDGSQTVEDSQDGDVDGDFEGNSLAETNESGLSEGALMRKWGLEESHRGAAESQHDDPIQEAMERRRVAQEAESLVNMMHDMGVSRSAAASPVAFERSLSIESAKSFCSSIERPLPSQEDEERSRCETPTKPSSAPSEAPRTPLSREMSGTLLGNEPQGDDSPTVSRHGFFKSDSIIEADELGDEELIAAVDGSATAAAAAAEDTSKAVAATNEDKTVTAKEAEESTTTKADNTELPTSSEAAENAVVTVSTTTPPTVAANIAESAESAIVTSSSDAVDSQQQEQPPMISAVESKPIAESGTAATSEPLSTQPAVAAVAGAAADVDAVTASHESHEAY